MILGISLDLPPRYFIIGFMVYNILSLNYCYSLEESKYVSIGLIKQIYVNQVLLHPRTTLKGKRNDMENHYQHMLLPLNVDLGQHSTIAFA